jgi:hypothetical protein
LLAREQEAILLKYGKNLKSINLMATSVNAGAPRPPIGAARPGPA